MSVGGGGTGYLDSPDHMTLSPQQALARSHTAHHTPSKRDAATPEDADGNGLRSTQSFHFTNTFAV